MIEVTGNLWTYPADFRVITTNGARRSDGCAVMGRGCAREAAVKWPNFPAVLGARIRKQGNHVHLFRDWSLFTFPVKHHWQEPADYNLIIRSVYELNQLIVSQFDYVMPRPGCGNGGLAWVMVQPLLVSLPDNVKVIDFPATVQGGRDD